VRCYNNEPAFKQLDMPLTEYSVEILLRSAESLTISIKRDISDCIANMRLLDQSYLAAGLEPREPSNPLGN